MPDWAPEEYKKLARRCCDADPNKRPELWNGMLEELMREVSEDNFNDNFNDNIWNVYQNDVRSLSRRVNIPAHSCLLGIVQVEEQLRFLSVTSRTRFQFAKFRIELGKVDEMLRIGYILVEQINLQY